MLHRMVMIIINQKVMAIQHNISINIHPAMAMIVTSQAINPHMDMVINPIKCLVFKCVFKSPHKANAVVNAVNF